MSDNVTLRQAGMVAKVLAAFRLTHFEHLTVKEACEDVGITPYQYWYWLRTDDGAIDNIRQAIVESEREQLDIIMRARAVAVIRIADMVPVIDNASDLVKVDAYLRDLQRELEERQGADDKPAGSEFLLTGPVQSPQRSRFGSTVNVKTNADGSVDISMPIPDKDIIDV